MESHLLQHKEFRFLFITANVGSVFEDPSLLNGWMIEHQLLLRQHNPDFVAFSFQEIGGKDSAFMENVDLFLKQLQKLQQSSNEEVYFSSGLIYDWDINSSHFTALANTFFVRSSVIHSLQHYNFLKEAFENITDPHCTFFQTNLSPTQNQEVTSLEKWRVNTQHYSFAHHQRFSNSKSRKGFLHTKWRFDNNKEFDLVNIHLFHDDLNSISLKQTPSLYSTNRLRVLKEAIEKCQLSETVPAFLFGDFNTRLDAEFMHWLRDKYLVDKDLSFPTDTSVIIDPFAKQHYYLEQNGRTSPNTVVEHQHSLETLNLPQILSIEEKSFFFANCHQLFAIPSEARSHFAAKTSLNWLQHIQQSFDKEIQRYNSSCVGNMQLHEFKIHFGPSYCLDWNTPKNEEDCTENNGNDIHDADEGEKLSPNIVRYEYVKRIPGWCDRVLFNNSAKQLFQETISNAANETHSIYEYNAIDGHYSTGDHKPVYLYFKMNL